MRTIHNQQSIAWLFYIAEIAEGGIKMDVSMIFAGVSAGVTLALTGFAKKEGKKFDYKKFGATIITGAGVGIIAPFSGMEMSTTYEYAISMGIIPVVENLLKAIYRRLKKTGVFVPIQKE